MKGWCLSFNILLSTTLYKIYQEWLNIFYVSFNLLFKCIINKNQSIETEAVLTFWIKNNK